MSDPDHSDGDNEFRLGPNYWRGVYEELDKPPSPAPGWVDYNNAWRENARRDRIAARPRVWFLFFERNLSKEGYRSIGVKWDKDPNPDEGCMIYRRSFVIHIAFKVWLERR